ncbi:SDR family NAD(P)-dependent oxidoreductase [Streptomyces sp. NPDC005760]|uniref:SDR family NAD(P)-dependent oxidoreductase n=1 Tax=Streptomyces sp. NPDC005760 TaxID=3156718 RepID=UPI0033F8D7B2
MPCLQRSSPGGTTGIGRATAELLHARGYQVAVTGQNPESVSRARSELPGDVLVVRSDGRVLSDTEALMSAVSARSDRWTCSSSTPGSSVRHRLPR